MKRTYENALKILESRRRPARPKGLRQNPVSTIMPSVNGAPTFSGIPSLLALSVGVYSPDCQESDIKNLNLVHVAGTKGKGSTCAFIRSFLRVHGSRTGFPRKVGLYTSPDLTCIRERIQINDEPILEETFTKYFFEVWEKLSSQAAQTTAEHDKLPRYLQLLALLAFHTFIKENVDAAICETHHGGEYDATNFIQEPVVTGITPIGLDHITQLGPSIENIAWHKSGIFKPGAPAFSAPQIEQPANVMRSRAVEKGVELTFVPTDNSLPTDARALKVKAQQTNCSLALAMVDAFLERKAPQEHQTLTSDDIRNGIERFNWPGRYETIIDGSHQWFLDGAHNELSLEQTAEWFKLNSLATTGAGQDSFQGVRILIFSHFSAERDGFALVNCLANALSKNNIKPNHVIFTTYQERRDGTTRIDKTLKTPETPFPDLPSLYAKEWKTHDPTATVLTESTIEGALDLAKKIGDENNGMQTLVTGSLHLVGGALNVLRPV